MHASSGARGFHLTQRTLRTQRTERTQLTQRPERIDRSGRCVVASLRTLRWMEHETIDAKHRHRRTLLLHCHSLSVFSQRLASCSVVAHMRTYSSDTSLSWSDTNNAYYSGHIKQLYNNDDDDDGTVATVTMHNSYSR